MGRFVEVVAFLTVWGFAGAVSLAETVEFADEAPCGPCTECTECTECDDCSACSETGSMDDKKEAANVALYQAFVERVENGGDMEFAEEVLAPDFVEHQGTAGLPEGLSGVEAFKMRIGKLRGAFPDARILVEAIYARGDDVVARYRMVGTHTGMLDGIPPTGKKVDFSGTTWIRFKDGKAIARWGVSDDAGMMRQLGLLPGVPTEHVVKPSQKDVGERMSPEAAEKLLRRFYDALINQRNLDVLDELIAPDFVDHSPWNAAETVQDLKALFKGLFAAFPDFKATVEDLIVVGDKVITRVKMSGTNTGELMGMPPTGKPMTTRLIEVNRVGGGKIREHWENWDEFGFLTQLGLVPPMR